MFADYLECVRIRFLPYKFSRTRSCIFVYISAIRQINCVSTTCIFESILRICIYCKPCGTCQIICVFRLSAHSSSPAVIWNNWKYHIPFHFFHKSRIAICDVENGALLLTGQSRKMRLRLHLFRQFRSVRIKRGLFLMCRQQCASLTNFANKW